MLQIHRLRLDHGALEGENRRRVTNNPTPCFSWAAAADGKERRQAACRVTVSSGSSPLWDSGWIEQEAQELRYAGPPLPAERRIAFTVEIRDACGEQSPPASAWFYLSALPGLPANWIAPQEDVPGRPLYFRRRFAVRPGLESAALYICGLGYHQAALDGVDLTDAVLDPAVTDYSKRVSYVFLPELEERLGPGEHCLSVVVAEGWRRNEGPYLRCIGERAIPFFGRPQLSALLRLGYADGTVETVEADESWLCGTGEIVSAHLFNGETTDRRQAVPGWNRADGEPKEFQPARRVPPPGGVPEVMELEPIREQERVPARSVTPLRDGVSIVDFGKNLAGVCRLKLPDRLLPGQEIVLEHMEFLDEEGDLYLPTLRGARCRDTYIAAGDGQDPAFWQPRFTYHGFRYARVTGLPLVDKADIQAVVLRTDAAPAGVFTCGSGLVNAIQAAIVQTERSNMHSLLTDCPQRDERMGWLNDATVRFEETPYNFDIGRLFPKVIRDILDTQEADGSITCTAPRIYGERPADPVCSSFLVAGLQALLHTGNLDILRQAYDGFVRWEECLEGLADGYILRYSHYGDWAGPVYACEGGDTDIDAVRSLETPGELLSTGYFYYNAVLLADFAGRLQRPQDAARFSALAASIREAMLALWWDGKSGRMATGSQGCQSFVLWLGILPEEGRALAAHRLHEDLVRRDYRITTGNLCTRYLMDALTENGYVDDAWRLITREEYPSIGYMLQQEATTIWERFELKKTPGMNSHNHPMYGAVGYWFYAYIAGVRPTAPGFAEADIRPFFPEALQSASAVLDTVRGELSVRWVKRYRAVWLYVTVPFGVRATVYFGESPVQIGSGSWTFSRPLPPA